MYNISQLLSLNISIPASIDYVKDHTRRQLEF